MRSRTLAALSMAAALLVTGTAATQSAAAAVASVEAEPTDCPREQYRPTDDDKKKFYCGFKELGPRTLPTGPVGKLLNGYYRFGGLTPQQFLSWYRDGLDWKYPAADGFREVNGTVDQAVATVPKDTKLDRFGSSGGRYLSTAGTAYSARAIPPDSLNPIPDAQGVPQDSYHCYVVVKEFKVLQGHIAAAFAQPGGGVQQWLKEDAALKPAELGTDPYYVSSLLKYGFLDEKPATTCTG
ncbi:TNT domain-containing protein [Kitasatospora sp. NPDC002965]|uniref:TNT domain-containing protein n=1 Tax=Kitasatospora sp. NPDC002965 TaxID=3154775 RepID=UPI0033B5A21F